VKASTTMPVIRRIHALMEWYRAVRTMRRILAAG
jgi:hypothetical protein